MTFSHRILTAFFFSILMSTNVAHAQLIIDTGPGQNSNGGTTLSTEQFLAGRFDLIEGTTITGLEMWLLSVAGADNYGTIVLYEDFNNFPGQELESMEFQAQDGVTGPYWMGRTDLDWSVVDSGRYWAAFEVRPGQTLHGAAPSIFPPSSGNPLDRYAFKNAQPQQSPQWYGDANAYGMRIYGNTAVPIPEPATMVLLAGGLVGTILRFRSQ